jgi:AcrR family transcriptional regulator
MNRSRGHARQSRNKQDKAPSSGAPVPKKTRDHMLYEARNILEEGGYAAASVQAIAERCGVAAGTLYRHFPSKADLFVELVREAANRDIAAMKAAASSGGSIERLEAIVATFARRALRKRRLAWALIHEPVDPAVDAERLIYRREYCRRMAKLLRQGIAAGEIPPQNVELSAAAIVGAIAESMVGPLSPIGAIGSEEDLIATLVRFCRRSLGVPDNAALRTVTAKKNLAGARQSNVHSSGHAP